MPGNNPIGNYQFFDYAEKHLNAEVIFLVGACRSGKSSLGRLLGSYRHVYHVEESWLLLMAPVMCEKGMVKEDVFVQLYRTWIHELVYDVCLMRAASFRRGDHSYIHRMKSDEDILYSLEQLSGRSDVDAYFKKEKVTIVLNLAEVNPYIHLLEKVYPSANILIMEREPDITAKEIYEKQWFSHESLTKPGNHQIFLKYGLSGETYYLPFWVGEESAEPFVKMSEQERAQFYVQRQAELTKASIAMANKPKLTTVSYEKLLKDPKSVASAILSTHQEGEKTPLLCQEIKERGVQR